MHLIVVLQLFTVLHIEFYFSNTCIDIRLSRGINAAEGIIEINEDHRWRTVCNKTFNDFAAALVCRQLRFGLPVQYHGNSLVVHSEVFFITYYSSSTFCRESSQRFSNCLYYYRSTRNCHDTFLKCSSMYVLFVIHSNYNVLKFHQIHMPYIALLFRRLVAVLRNKFHGLQKAPLNLYCRTKYSRLEFLWLSKTLKFAKKFL